MKHSKLRLDPALVLLLIVLGVNHSLPPVASGDQSGDPKTAYRVVVFPFERAGEPSKASFLGLAMPTLLGVALMTSDRVQVVAGGDPVAIFPPLLNVGAGFEAHGQILEYRGQLRIEATVGERGGERRVELGSVVVSAEHVFNAVEDLARQLESAVLELAGEPVAQRIAIGCFNPEPAVSEERAGWLGLDLAAALTELPRGSDFVVLPWRVTRELCAGTPDSAAPAPDLSAFSDTDAVVSGSYGLDGKRIVVRPKIVLTDLAPAGMDLPSVEGSLPQILRLEERLNREVAAALEAVIDGSEWRFAQFEDLGGDVEALRDRGLAHLHGGEPYLARLAALRAILSDPENSDGHLLLALSLHQLGWLEDALAATEKVEALLPGHPEVLVLKAETLVTLRRFDEVQAIYETLVEQEPAAVTHRLALGTVLALRERKAEAIKVLEEARGLATPVPEGELGAAATREEGVAILNLLATLYHSEGRHEDAEQALREVLAIDPTNTTALRSLSQLLLRKAIEASRGGEIARAIELCRNSLDLAPSAPAYAFLTNTLLAWGAPEDVIAVGREAESVGETSSPLHNNMALAFDRLGDIEQALRYIDLAIAEDKYDLVAISNKALILSEAGREEAALRFIESVDVAPDQRWRWFLLKGRILWEARDYEGVVAACGESIALRADDWEALNLRAVALLRLFRWEEAESDLRAAIAAEEAGEQREGIAHSNLASLLSLSGRCEEAVGFADRAIELRPKGAPGYSHKGWCIYQAGAREVGLALLHRAVELDEGYAGAHFNLARVHAIEGRPEQALGELSRAGEIDPFYAELALRTPELKRLRDDPALAGTHTTEEPPADTAAPRSDG